MCIKSHVNPAMSSYVGQEENLKLDWLSIVIILTGIITTNGLQNQMITEHRIEFEHDFD